MINDKMIESDPSIKGFITTLYKITHDKDLEHIIRFIDNGNKIEIVNLKVFTQDVLNKYFRHQRFSSFVRQLNIYGFNKINIKKRYIFENKYFKKNCPELLYYIKRKINSNKIENNIRSVDDIKQEINEVRVTLLDQKKKYEAMVEKNRELIEDNKLILLEILNTKKDIEVKIEDLLKNIMMFTSKKNEETKTNSEENNNKIVVYNNKEKP